MTKQSHKLTEAQRLEILKAYRTEEHHADIARRFSVHPAYVRKLASRRGVSRRKEWAA